MTAPMIGILIVSGFISVICIIAKIFEFFEK